MKKVKRYLIEYSNIEESLNKNGCKAERILQTYLQAKDQVVERCIRRTTKKGNFIYDYVETPVNNDRDNEELFIKKEMSDKETLVHKDISDEEIIRNISFKEYMKLMTEVDREYIPLEKSCYSFSYKDKNMKVTIFHNTNCKPLLEVFLTNDVSGIIIPSFLKLIRELDENEEYSCKCLSKQLNLSKRNDKKD